MSKTNELQDLYLSRARRSREPVTMFLMNGFQMRGIITGFDPFVVVLDSDGKQQIIYKHAISTVVANHPIDLSPDNT
ncbi:MAG: RNA chaperone Hfq [Oscillospiraceae bacterium]|nr:RNA chaperone Hfq [Oscillospiraceae bacterium]